MLKNFAKAKSLRFMPAAVANGIGQVMFQPCILTGLLFLVGIFIGSIECGMPQIGAGALTGAVSATLAGTLISPDLIQHKAGIWGFNGTLIGCAFPTFFAANGFMWGALIFFSILSPVLQKGLNSAMSACNINSLTIPFVLLTWIAILAAQSFGNLKLIATISDSTSINDSLNYTLQDIAIYCLKGISQVFLINSWITGIICIIALAIYRRRAAIWAIIGSGTALTTSILLGASYDAIANGLYGFSPVLTAIALGCTFSRPGVHNTIITLIAIVFTVILQGAMNVMLLPAGIPALTAPFCIVTWVFMLSSHADDDVSHSE